MHQTCSLGLQFQLNIIIIPSCTPAFFPPEWDMEPRDNGKFTTVYLMYACTCTQWCLGYILTPFSSSPPSFCKECCHLIKHLLQQNPSLLIGLDHWVILHSWFKPQSFPNFSSFSCTSCPKMPRSS